MLEPHLHTLAALIAAQPDRTLADWFSAALRPRHPAALWSIFAPPFSLASAETFPSSPSSQGDQLAKELLQVSRRER